MWGPDVAVEIAAAAFVLQVILAIAGGMWALARLDRSIRDALAQHREEIDQKIAEMERRNILAQAATERTFGEVASAIRQKITEVELYGRDTYLRRDSFYTAIKELSEQLRTQIADLKNDFRSGQGRKPHD